MTATQIERKIKELKEQNPFVPTSPWYEYWLTKNGYFTYLIMLEKKGG